VQEARVAGGGVVGHLALCVKCLAIVRLLCYVHDASVCLKCPNPDASHLANDTVVMFVVRMDEGDKPKALDAVTSVVDEFLNGWAASVFSV